MLKSFFRFWDTKKASVVTVEQTPTFNWVGGGAVPAPANWADWLKNRPAPLIEPNTRRYPLSRYWFGSQGHGDLRLEFTNRWGHVLDITGLSSGISEASMRAIFADAQTANPVTDNGKLAKLALSDPAKYKVQVSLTQGYPTSDETPDGYSRDAGGNLTNAWSPLAPVSAMTAAVEYSTASLRVVKEFGLQVAIVYHGGETGLKSFEEGTNGYVTDPAVLSAKGARSWFDFLSERKGLQIKQFRDRVQQLAPERSVYVFYPSDARPYGNYIPGNPNYSFDYQYMKTGTDLPSSSNYYWEFNAEIGDPKKKDTSILGALYPQYYDLATNCLAAVIEQIQSHSQPLSYNFVCPTGWYRADDANTPAIDPVRLSNPLRAIGYMKFEGMAGSIGFVDGYFGPDCVPGFPVYPAFNNTDPPPWLINSMIIAEGHARFSHLDRFIFEGDLLPGIRHGKAKKQFPAYEFDGYRQIGGFYLSDAGVRVLVRKVRGSEDYLILVWVVEGKDRKVWIRDIPGVRPFELNGRIKGSLYTLSVVNGVASATWQDPPIPNPVDRPVFIEAYFPTSSSIALKFFAARSLDPSNLPPVSSFSVSGSTVSSVSISHLTRLHDLAVLNLAAPLASSTNVTITYNGIGLKDSEGNVAPALSTSAQVPPQWFTTIPASVSYENRTYTSLSSGDWSLSRLVSTVKLNGDGSVVADLSGAAVLGLSEQSTDVGIGSIKYLAIRYDTIYAANDNGVSINVNGASTYKLVGASQGKLSRTGSTVTFEVRRTGQTAWTLLCTFTATSSSPLYLHGAFNTEGSTIANIELVGFT